MLREMTVEELSDLTRIPLRSLERLESGQFDGETDGFVRGFVRTVAEALGLDAEDAVSRMLQEAPASAWEKHGPGRSAKQTFAIVVFLLFVGFALLGLRAIWNLLLGDASQPVSREVVLWRDPVRALAEATGERVDPKQEIEPRKPAAMSARRAPVEPVPIPAPASPARALPGRPGEPRATAGPRVLAESPRAAGPSARGSAAARGVDSNPGPAETRGSTPAAVAPSGE